MNSELNYSSNISKHVQSKVKQNTTNTTVMNTLPRDSVPIAT